MTAFTYTYKPQVTMSGTSDNVTIDTTASPDIIDNIVTSPFFIMDNWEELRLAKEKANRESNKVHLEVKRKELFKHNR